MKNVYITAAFSAHTFASTRFVARNRLMLIAILALLSTAIRAQDDGIGKALTSVAAIGAETRTAVNTPDTTRVDTVTKPVIPVWKQKLYYGYNFDIYYHNDSKATKKENGWSIRFEPEIGWKLKERVYLGVRLGGCYQDSYTTFTLEKLDGTTYDQDLRIQHGQWEVTPYARYRLKTIFNGKVGIWLEGHLYAGMDFPRVNDGEVKGTDYDGLRYSATYGLQVAPVITYQFNRKSTFQIFFSIISFGYSGTTRFYRNDEEGNYREYTNDVIIFSGKLRNLIANQFTPALYGLKFGIQKSF